MRNSQNREAVRSRPQRGHQPGRVEGRAQGHGVQPHGEGGPADHGAGKEEEVSTNCILFIRCAWNRELKYLESGRVPSYLPGRPRRQRHPGRGRVPQPAGRALLLLRQRPQRRSLARVPVASEYYSIDFYRQPLYLNLLIFQADGSARYWSGADQGSSPHAGQV